MANYGRFLQVTAGPASWGFSGVGPEANTALRIRFMVRKGVDLGFNIATVKLNNVNPSVAQQLVALTSQPTNPPITIDAGYQDNHGVIFHGQIRQAIYGRESPTDTLLQLICSTFDLEYTYGVVNKSLAAGSTMMDHFNHAVQAMAAVSQSSIAVGYIDPALNISQPVYPKSVQLYGQANRVLWRIARSKQANVFDDQDKIHLLGYANTMPGGAIVLNSQTGLVGMPTLESGGLMARSLLNPSIRIGGTVQIAQSLIQQAARSIVAGQLDPSLFPSIAADGNYKVLTITYNADSRGNSWYADLGCRDAAPNAYTPPALSHSTAAPPT